MSYKGTSAIYLLYFLETCEATNIAEIPLTYQLEHIVPQKKKDKLTNTELLHNIGNLTLLEGKNTVGIQRGNASLGAKPYNEKKPHYASSNSKITRQIAKRFEKFEEGQINERNSILIELINKYTDY